MWSSAAAGPRSISAPFWSSLNRAFSFWEFRRGYLYQAGQPRKSRNEQKHWVLSDKWPSFLWASLLRTVSCTETERERGVQLPRSSSQPTEAGQMTSSIFSEPKVIFVKKMDHCRRVRSHVFWWVTKCFFEPLEPLKKCRSRSSLGHNADSDSHTAC